MYILRNRFALDSRDGAAVLALARKKKSAGGLRTRHFSRWRTANRAQGDRRRVDWPSGFRSGVHAQPRHESWHPNHNSITRGRRPDVRHGPYYITALVNFLGPIARIVVRPQSAFPERTITSLPLAGTKIPVETPTT